MSSLPLSKLNSFIQEFKRDSALDSHTAMNILVAMIRDVSYQYFPSICSEHKLYYFKDETISVTTYTYTKPIASQIFYKKGDLRVVSQRPYILKMQAHQLDDDFHR